MSDVEYEFLIENGRSEKLSLMIEPWGEAKEIGPGSRLRLRVEGPSPSDPAHLMMLRVEGGNKASVWAWAKSTIAVVDT